MGNAFNPNTSTTKSVSVTRKHWTKTKILTYIRPGHRIVQNFLAIWLDANYRESDQECQYAMSQLKQIFNSIKTFIDANECYRTIENIKDEQIFLIVSGSMGQTFVERIHEHIRLDSIYIFCSKPGLHQPWTQSWKKIKCVANQIEEICQSMINDISQCEHDLTPISILSLNNSQTPELNQIEPTFMYSQLLKEILLEMKYDEKDITDLSDFCNEQYVDNEYQLTIINEFRHTYRQKTPIWWYTRECFLYHMLNRSLRIVDIEIITFMGFFMKDLHEQLKRLYQERTDRTTPILVYRGQGMFNDEFAKLRKNIGGLFAFNAFLSTTKKLEVAKTFAEKTGDKLDKTSVLFYINIDPRLTSIPFALLDGISYYDNHESEVLFSMHTVFRINSVEQETDHLWKVALTSVSDTDVQITRLMEQIRRELGEGTTTDRLGKLMIRLGEFDKAETLYQVLMDSTDQNDDRRLAHIYCQLGYIKNMQKDSSKAETFYNNALKIQEKLRPIADIDLATTYNNMGLMYSNREDDTNALAHHQKALTIREKHLHPNHIDLATTYNNIGLVYYQMQKYSTALSYCEKTLHIYKQILDDNHPWLATLYKNIGLAEISMGQRTVGLENLHKAMNIRKISLPHNHPSLASIYSTIAGVYLENQDYSTASEFYQQAINIEKLATQSQNFTLAMDYYQMSKSFEGLKKYREAVKCAELAVQYDKTSSNALKYQKNLDRLRANL